MIQTERCGRRNKVWPGFAFTATPDAFDRSEVEARGGGGLPQSLRFLIRPDILFYSTSKRHRGDHSLCLYMNTSRPARLHSRPGDKMVTPAGPPRNADLVGIPDPFQTGDFG